MSERRKNTLPGSSPRGRGKHHRGPHRRGGERLIPARAGKTPRVATPQVNHPAHPRAGGENHARRIFNLWLGGSSPRGRGKRDVCARQMPAVRLIPARAGKTTTLLGTLAASRAHPRAGGENLPDLQKLVIGYGSSPRGRGKLDVAQLLADGIGLIPARAGKTFRAFPGRERAGAHPRAGGENQTNGNTGGGELGSSPRGRGKRSPGARVGITPRLIPARAGKTMPSRHASRLIWAHPRAGGENRRAQTAIRRPGGSSPRGRGKPLRGLQRPGPQGLIPARAGKTS